MKPQHEGPDDPTPEVQLAVTEADLRDELEAWAKSSRTRLRVAGAATLAAPVNFLVQALIFWRDGWPAFGPAVSLLMVLFAAFFWVKWWPVEKETRRREEDLERFLEERSGPQEPPSFPAHDGGDP